MSRLCRYSTLAMNRKISAPFHIQLAVDGSEYSTASTQLIRDLPLPPHSCITILGVVPPGQSLYGSKLMHAQPLPVKADIFGHTMGPIAYLMPSMPILADLSTSSHQAELQKHKGASHSRRDETDLGSCGSQDKGGNSGRRPCFSNSDVFSIARDRPDRSRDARTQCD